MTDSVQIRVPELCHRHLSLLVHQARYKETDPWQALVVVASIALFQGASADPKIQAELGGDIVKMETIGCLGCRKPDLFGQVVEVAKKHDLGAIKALGEKWVTENTKP